MAELTMIPPKSISNPDAGLPPLADILPPAAPKAATLELERIGDGTRPRCAAVAAGSPAR